MKTLSAPHARRAGLAAILLLLPLVLQSLGHHWVRVADTSLLYVMLALGLPPELEARRAEIEAILRARGVIA